MSIDEIMNGSSEKSFPGLLPLIQDYLRNIEVDTDTMCTLSRYWIYLQRKAQCRIMTNARFMREFVQKVRIYDLINCMNGHGLHYIGFFFCVIF